PAQLTFPNVFNAAPGAQLDFLSFDHTTGMLVIEGTATVSADGKTVTTDPGMGITHPGWHGLTPPGGCGGSGGAPTGPVPQGDELFVHGEPHALDFITGDQGATNFTPLTFEAPPPNPALPLPFPIPGCQVPQHETGPQQPFVNVTIVVD